MLYGIESFERLLELRNVNRTLDEIFRDENYLILWNNTLSINNIYLFGMRAMFPFIEKVIKCSTFECILPRIRDNMFFPIVEIEFEHLIYRFNYFTNGVGFRKVMYKFDEVIQDIAHKETKSDIPSIIYLVGSLSSKVRRINKIRLFFIEVLLQEAKIIHLILHGSIHNEQLNEYYTSGKFDLDIRDFQKLEYSVRDRIIDKLPAFSDFPKLLETITKQGLIDTSFPIVQSTRTQIINGRYKSHCKCYGKTLEAVCERLYELFERNDKNLYLKLKKILFST
jgi:hypothetical protein